MNQFLGQLKTYHKLLSEHISKAKKGQMSVGMLGFLQSFFFCTSSRQLIQIQKKIAKNEHPDKSLDLFILSML